VRFAIRNSKFAIALFVVAALAQGPQAPPELELAFVCPMHPDYTLDVAGMCPRCGMALVRAAPYDTRDYKLDFRTAPPVVRPGRKATFLFQVFHPGANEPIRNFEVVHERQYHLFVISQDMDYFQHIHPEQREDGTWSIDVTLPKAGYYKVLSDFMPRGGSSQFIARPLVTAGYAGDLAASNANLVPDTAMTRTVDGLTATVVFDPPIFAAGLYGHITYRLSDAATGRPITDLQTYLGAFGHTLIMSEDMVDYVHAHPLDIVPGTGDDGAPPEFVIPPGADLERLRGGPEVTFEGLMPRPGRYRAWTQFRRAGKLYTFTFTFSVAAS
jgi:hypothetical protein